MKANELYQAGELQKAITAATEEVKQNPADTNRRWLLAELLCFAGELDRADRQLDTLAHQSPDAAVGVALFRQLVRAEQARQAFYAQGAVPELLSDPSPAIKLHLEASILLREGKPAEAQPLLAQAEELRPKVKGVCNGQPFDDLRDADDLTAPIFEVLTSTGKYYWVATDQIELLELREPTRPRDLLWQRAHMIVRNGPDGEVYLPTLYGGSHADPDEKVRLGRVTEWRGGDGAPVRGAGLRTYLVGEEGRTILELKELSTAGGAPA